VSEIQATLLGKLQEIPCRPIVVASHPRSGTHLCIDTLRLNFSQCHSWKYPLERPYMLYCMLDEWGKQGEIHEEQVLSVVKRVERPLIKTHALPGLGTVPMFPGGATTIDPQLAAWAWQNGKVIYMYRDGREVMRSFHRFFATETEHPQPFSEFLRQKIDGRSHARIWADHVESWLAEDQAACVSMESLLAEPAKQLADIARHVALPIPCDPKLPPRCDKDLASRLWRRAAVHPISSAVSSRYSGDPAPHWTDVFSPEDREFFHQEAGHLLIRLGYETSDRWVDSHQPQGAERRLVFENAHAENAHTGL
jgi:hypothetical protein